MLMNVWATINQGNSHYCSQGAQQRKRSVEAPPFGPPFVLITVCCSSYLSSLRIPAPPRWTAWERKKGCNITVMIVRGFLQTKSEEIIIPRNIEGFIPNFCFKEIMKLYITHLLNLTFPLLLY